MEQDDQHSLLLTRNFFLLHVHGTVEDVAFPGEDYDHLYCKVLFRCGPDWALVGEQQLQPQQASSSSKQSTTVGKHSHVPSVFISQTAVKGDDDGRPSACHQPLFVWNLPLEATFQSTNVFGWPQVVVTVYGGDSFGGGDTVRGYGWTHLPTRPGVHHLTVTLFTPQSSTALGRLSSWLGTAKAPEFVDDRLAAGSERSLVSVHNTGGTVRLNVSVLFKDFKKYGFVSR